MPRTSYQVDTCSYAATGRKPRQKKNSRKLPVGTSKEKKCIHRRASNRASNTNQPKRLLLGPQSRFGGKLLIIKVLCPHIWECGAKGVNRRRKPKKEDEAKQKKQNKNRST